jgi:antitoxin ParD1/3/4
MNVHLTDELERLVQSKVQSGRYNSASEVVREALRLLEERDELRALRKDELRKRIAEGLDAVKAGRVQDGEEVFERIDAELDQLERSDRA